MTFWVAGAAVVGTVGGALISSGAAGDAAGQQAQSSAAAIAEQARQYDTTRADYAPYRAAGVSALGTLQSDIDTPVTAADVMSDPGYQFGLTQGQQGLDRKTAAAGGRISGAALKAASSYATNYAASGYGAAYQRKQDRLNRLAAIAGIGQTATSGTAAAGTNAANNTSALTSAQGNAAGAASIAQGNIWGGAVNQLAAAGSKWASSTSSGLTNDGNTYNGDTWYG